MCQIVHLRKKKMRQQYIPWNKCIKSNEFRVAVDCVIMLLFIHLSVSILAFLAFAFCFVYPALNISVCIYILNYFELPPYWPLPKLPSPLSLVPSHPTCKQRPCWKGAASPPSTQSRLCVLISCVCIFFFYRCVEVWWKQVWRLVVMGLSCRPPPRDDLGNQMMVIK